jgi:pimeloyl-ACP methyl ester carboxylesterase
MVERQISALLSPTASEEVKTLVRSLGKQTPQAVCAGIKALRDRPDRRGELATLDCPTLVLVGAQDQLSPPSEVAEMAKAIPGARLVEIPHAGHLSSLENPEAFIHAISIFV